MRQKSRDARFDFIRPGIVWLLQNEQFQTVLAWLMIPAVALCEFLGIRPEPSGYALLGLVLLGWFMWARSIRVAYCTIARSLGIYHIRQYPYLTWLWLPWRKPFHALAFIRRWWRAALKGGDGANRSWTSFLETASYLFSPVRDCILIGILAFHRIRLFQPVAIPGGERHVFFCAAAGAGKTTQIETAFIGCLHPSQAACYIDCDGAMVNAHGAALEAEGHKVVKLDADNIAKGFPKAGHWNPMDEIARADRRHGRRHSVIPFCAILGEAMIVQDSQTQPVFADTARVFFSKSLLPWVYLFEAEKTLMRVRALGCSGLPERVESDNEDPFERLLFEMSILPLRQAAGEVDDGCDGEICAAIAAGAAIMKAQGRDGVNHFRSTLIYQTAWIDDPACRATMQSSDICGEDLKLTNAVVFLVASLTDIQTRLAPFFRAFTMLTLYAFQKTKPEMKLKRPCLFVLDEFPSLGRMETVATAAPGFRKYGVRLITVTQSLQRLQKSYPMEWRDFLGNAQCCIWMGLDDPETLRFLSEDMLGKCKRKEKIDGYHWSARMLLRCIGLKNLPPARYQMVERWLMDQQQCREWLDPAAGNIIVTRFGRAPIRNLHRMSYWKELPVWKYQVSGYGENRLRAFTPLDLRAVHSADGAGTAAGG